MQSLTVLHESIITYDLTENQESKKEIHALRNFIKFLNYTVLATKKEITDIYKLINSDEIYNKYAHYALKQMDIEIDKFIPSPYSLSDLLPNIFNN